MPLDEREVKEETSVWLGAQLQNTESWKNGWPHPVDWTEEIAKHIFIEHNKMADEWANRGADEKAGVQKRKPRQFRGYRRGSVTKKVS